MQPSLRGYPELSAYLDQHWHKRLHPRPIRGYPFARLRRRLDALGAPDLAVPSVLITGTKGKGSTCSILSAVLSEHGFRVGLFTSPHLLAVEERVAVDGEPIAPEEFAADFSAAAATQKADDGAAIYESVLLAALLAFRRRAVDVAVMEVRSGGRFDPLRAMRRVVAVGIAPVGRDHIPALGYSLSDIAWHKGGLLSRGRPAASTAQDPEAMQVLERLAHTRRVPLALEGRDWECSARARRPQGSRVRYTRQGGLELAADLNLLGRFQTANAGLALTLAAQALESGGGRLQAGPAAAGLARARWPGRMEALRLTPPLVYDGAHTPESAHALATALRQHFPALRWRLCVGLTGRREAAPILAPLAPLAGEVVAVPVPSAQAVDPGRVVEAARLMGLPAREAPSLEAALDGGPVCVTGSLYLYAALPEGARPSRLRFTA